MSKPIDTTTSRKRYSARRPQTLALGSIAAAGVGLAGCGDNFEGDYAFNTVQECVEQGVERDICEAEYQTALTEHAQSAPRFTTREECEAEYGVGKCNVVDNVSDNGQQRSFFVPFLTGYLVSSAVRDLTSYGAYRSYRAENTSYSSSPIYRNRAGRTVTTVRDPATNRPVTKPLNQNTRTVSRQGFGGRGYGRSGRGWGG